MSVTTGSIVSPCTWMTEIRWNKISLKKNIKEMRGRQRRWIIFLTFNVTKDDESLSCKQWYSKP